MSRAGRKKKPNNSVIKALLVTVELLLIILVVLLRNGQTPPDSEAQQPAENAGSTAALSPNHAAASSAGGSFAESTGMASADEQTGSGSSDGAETVVQNTGASPSSDDAGISALQEGTESSAESAARRSDYNEETWHLASDMVYTYRHQQEEGASAIAQLLDDLKRADPPLGALWEKVMAFWSEVNREDYVLSTLPEDLPRDGSLCFVTLGFQLLPDGEMAPELLERCRTALECLRRYPEAMLLLTGGGTAAVGNPATEADQMAAWFESQGISRERMIIENTSLTTTQNALNSIRILAEQYPQIRSLAIVSSDYHIRLGSLLFQCAAFLREFEEGDPACVVAANASFPTEGSSVFETISVQAQDLWSLMNPTY